MFQLLVSIDVDMIVNVSGGERRPDRDVRLKMMKAMRGAKGTN